MSTSEAQSERPKQKGKIIRYYSAWCGYPECYNREDLDIENTVLDAMRTIRELGWRKNQTYGWICPNHSKNDVRG